MEIKKEIFTVHSKTDGLCLEILALEPAEDGNVTGVLQLCHGMCENKERYLPLMEHLAERGIACVIHDHRGHGKSIKDGEDLGYMYGGGVHALVEDAYQVTKWAKKRWPGRSFILFGHSMGSMVVRCYMKKHDRELDGLLVCGSPGKNPALAAGKVIAAIQKRIFGEKHRCKMLEALSFGAYARAFRQEKSRFAWCCSDPEVIREYEASPLCGFTFTADGYQTLFHLMEETYRIEKKKNMNENIPILFIGGEEDPCIGGKKRFEEAMETMRLCGYENVSGKLYPGMRHEILNEKDKQQVFRDIFQFMNQVIKKKDGESE